MQIRDAGLPEPVRQHMFYAPHRRWQVDFAWPDLRIIVEIEGGIWKGIHSDDPAKSKSRHSYPVTFEKDATKYNRAVLEGWMLLRFGPNQINGRGRGSLRVYEGIDTLKEAIKIKMETKNEKM